MQAKPPPWRPPDPLPGPLETERLVVRWWSAADATGLHEAVAGDREALMPWLPWARTGHQSVEDSASTIRQFDAMRARGEDFTLGAFDRASGEVVGGTGFHRLAPDAHEAECGYWVRGSRQREGLCTEMTRAILSAGFRDWGLRRIHLRCAAANVGSRGVLDKLGLTLEGCERASRWTDGVGWDDYLTYGVLAQEWDVDTDALRG